MGVFGPTTTDTSQYQLNRSRRVKRTEIVWHIRNSAGQIRLGARPSPSLSQIHPVTSDEREWRHVGGVIACGCDDHIHSIQFPIGCDDPLRSDFLDSSADNLHVRLLQCFEISVAGGHSTSPMISFESSFHCQRCYVPTATHVEIWDKLLPEIRVHLGEPLTHCRFHYLPRCLLLLRALVEVWEPRIERLVDLLAVLPQVVGVVAEFLLFLFGVCCCSACRGEMAGELRRNPGRGAVEADEGLDH